MKSKVKKLTGCQQILKIVEQIKFDKDLKSSMREDMNRGKYQDDISFLLTQYQYEGTWNL